MIHSNQAEYFPRIKEIAEHIAQGVDQSDVGTRLFLQASLQSIITWIYKFHDAICQQEKIYPSLDFCITPNNRYYNRSLAEYSASKYIIHIGSGLLIEFINIFFSKKTSQKYTTLKTSIDKCIEKISNDFKKSELYSLFIYIFIFLIYSHEFTHCYFNHLKIKKELNKLNKMFLSDYSEKDLEDMADFISGLMIPNIYTPIKHLCNEKISNKVVDVTLFSLSILLIGVFISVSFMAFKSNVIEYKSHSSPEDRLYNITGEFIMRILNDINEKQRIKIVTNFKACLLYFIPKYEQEFLYEEIDERGNIPEQGAHFYRYFIQKVENSFVQRNRTLRLKEDLIHFLNVSFSTPEA